MAYPSYDSTGFYSSLTFPGYTPPPGAPTKRGASPPATSGKEMLYSRPWKQRSAGQGDGMVDSGHVSRAEAAAPLRHAPAPPPRTNSPIYAPPSSQIRQMGRRDGGTRQNGPERAPRIASPPRRKSDDADGVYSKRHGSPSPQLVSGTMHMSSRNVPATQPDLVRTPSPRTAEKRASSAAAVLDRQQPQQQRRSPSTTDDEGPPRRHESRGDRLDDALKAFNDECRDLLSMLGAERDNNADSSAPMRQSADAEPALAEVPTRRDSGDGEQLPAGGGDKGHPLALKWALFLADSRLQQLDRLRQSPLGSPQVFESATKAAFSVRDALLSLDSLLHSTVGETEGKRDTEEETQRERQLCTTVSNGLASLSLAESEVLAVVLGCGAATVHPAPPPSSEGDRDPKAVDHPSLLRSAAQADPPREETLRGELVASAALLQRLQAENTAAKAALQDLERRREKTKRHLQREREEKAEIAKHFDVVAGDNAELHRRIRHLEEELLQQQKRCDTLAQQSSRAPLTDEERAAMEAGREEYSRLKAQMDRQTDNLRTVRDELLSSERENDGLRSTVAQLRDSLVRHRTVIDLLTRNQPSRTPPPPPSGPSGGKGTPQPTTRGPSRQMIEGILAGTISVPSSSSPSPSNRTSFSHNAVDWRDDSSSSPSSVEPEYEIARV